MSWPVKWLKPEDLPPEVQEILRPKVKVCDKCRGLGFSIYGSLVVSKPILCHRCKGSGVDSVLEDES